MTRPSRGRLIVTEGELANSPKGTLEFTFNPTEYTISKTNSWHTAANKGRNVPRYEFVGGEPRQLQVELLFDAYLTRAGARPPDLRQMLGQLFSFMRVDKSPHLRGKHSRLSRPPRCRLEWGQQTKDLAFPCYITHCSVRYLMFDEQGVPIRATATLTLKEAADAEDRPPTNPTSLGEPGRRVRQVAEGDRLDWIAYQEYGDPGEWRRIAEANRLADPLDLRPGMTLAIPPR